MITAPTFVSEFWCSPVNMDYGRKYIVLSDFPSEEVNRRFEKVLNLLWLLPLEESRACGD